MYGTLFLFDSAAFTREEVLSTKYHTLKYDQMFYFGLGCLPCPPARSLSLMVTSPFLLSLPPVRIPRGYHAAEPVSRVGTVGIHSHAKNIGTLVFATTMHAISGHLVTLRPFSKGRPGIEGDGFRRRLIDFCVVASSLPVLTQELNSNVLLVFRRR